MVAILQIPAIERLMDEKFYQIQTI